MSLNSPIGHNSIFQARRPDFTFKQKLSLILGLSKLHKVKKVTSIKRVIFCSAKNISDLPILNMSARLVSLLVSHMFTLLILKTKISPTHLLYI